MSTIDNLKAQIDAGNIIFDTTPVGTEQKLKQELLGLNQGTKVTPLLQNLVLEISKLRLIRISSLLRGEAGSLHGVGRAVDIGNEEIAIGLLPCIETDAKVQELRIDEIIFDAAVAGEADRNRWNYDAGLKHDFNSDMLDQHKNHIHFAVKAD